jgi:hypothetical protein
LLSQIFTARGVFLARFYNDFGLVLYVATRGVAGLTSFPVFLAASPVPNGSSAWNSPFNG